MIDDKTFCVGCQLSSYLVLDQIDGKRYCKWCKSKKQHPYWPRGQHNGQRIMGASIKAAIDFRHCRLVPRYTKYTGCISWLWFLVWVEAVYE